MTRNQVFDFRMENLAYLGDIHVEMSSMQLEINKSGVERIGLV